MAEPDRHPEVLVDVADILAEELAGKKRVGSILGTRLVRRKVVVSRESLVEVVRTVGAFQEVANRTGTHELPEKPFAP